jgi:hypothetical protein
MLPIGAVSSGVFPGLAWSAYKVASPAMGAWAARSRGVLQASGPMGGVEALRMDTTPDMGLGFPRGCTMQL